MEIYVTLCKMLNQGCCKEFCIQESYFTEPDYSCNKICKKGYTKNAKDTCSISLELAMCTLQTLCLN